MAPRYIIDQEKLLLTLTVVLIFMILTARTKQCTSKKTERDSYVIKNIGIKLCHLKCAEHGECASIEYDSETLTCHLLRDKSKMEKEGHVPLERSHSHVPTVSCKCSFGQRCLKTRSGKEVCVQDSTDPKPNTLSQAPVMTQDSDPHVSAPTSDGSEGLTTWKTVPAAPVTTQDPDPCATLSPADHLFWHASRDGHLVKVKRILSAGHVNINGNQLCHSWTPAMVAAANGRRRVVEFLVSRGADVSLVNNSGDNILHLACGKGDLKTVKLILSLKALNINAKNNYGHTAADIARRKGHKHVVDLLLSHGDH